VLFFAGGSFVRVGPVMWVYLLLAIAVVVVRIAQLAFGH
jgi:hypothetical protein